MRRLVPFLLAAALSVVLFVGVGAALFAAFILRELPEIYTLQDYRPNLVTRVLARDGTEIATLYRERREVEPIERMPAHLVEAFISAEDNAFYEHEGLDYRSILRAMLANLRAGGIQQGGSTITQQVAKTFLLTADRTWLRKMKDMVLAMRIERSLDKNEILYLYLNQIYLGSGAYGVQAAARTYFGKPVSDLSLAESALIAGLVPAPSRYTPRSNPQAARNRQRFVLRRMHEEGYITTEQREQALAEELVYAQAVRNPLRAASAYFTEEVRRYLEKRFGAEEMLTGGLTVYTTLDVARQLDAYRAVRRGLREQDQRQGYRGPIRVVPRDGWQGILQQLAEEPPPPPETEIPIVAGLVIEVDDERGVARIALGPATETQLTLEELNWARPPDPTLDGAVPRVRRVSEALKPGYLVWLEVQPGTLLDWPDPNQPIDPNAPPPLHHALYQEPQVEGALVAMDVATSEVQALLGGYSFRRSQFNRAVQSRRQPGSAFKPIIYSAALTHGYTPATIVYDTPIVYEDVTRGVTWKPGNYSDRFYGPITLRSAFAHSRNVATIKILRDIGIPPVLEMADAMGIRESLEANLSLALGASEVTLAELVRAYATFPSGGRLVSPIFIREIRDRSGRRIEGPIPLLTGEREDATVERGDRNSLEALLDEIRSTVDREDDPDALPPGFALDPVTAYLITDLLRAVVQEGTGWRAKALRRPVAGKTGTTNNLHDAWFIGFSPQLVTGVWVGYDVARNLGKNETGSRAACPIFVDYMRSALADLPALDFEVPPGIVFARIDGETGLLARPGDRTAIFQPFREGTVPEPLDTGHGPARLSRPARLD